MLGQDDMGDEFYKLVQKGFYVNPPSKPICSSTIPSDGSEFIHKSRMEEINLKYDLDEESTPKSEEPKEAEIKAAGRKKAAEFGRYAMKLGKEKKLLKTKFPPKLALPVAEKEWCLFCLGSELSSKIYPESFDEVDVVHSHDPVLSIVLHLEQTAVKLLLKYLFQWYESVGLEETVGKWIYALFACLEKPLDEDFKEFLETFYDDLKEKRVSCDELKKEQMYMFSSILEHYFVVNFDKIGSPLDRFIM